MLLDERPHMRCGLSQLLLATLLAITPARVILAETVNYMDSVVIIITDGPSATGFIANLDGKNYIFTTLTSLESTSLMRFRTLRGNDLAPTRLEAAENQDIVRLEFKDSEQYVSALALSDQPPQTYDKATIIGNSDGDFVASSTKCIVSAIGPSLFEFSGSVNEGNRGAPVIQANGDVVGVFAYINSTEGDEKTPTKILPSGHAAIRSDEIINLNWVGVSPSLLKQQTKLLDDLRVVHSHFSGVYPSMKTEKTKTQERVYSRIFETRSKKWTDIGYKASNRDSFHDAIWYDKLKSLCDSHDKLVEMRFREGKALRSHDTRGIMNAFKGSLSFLTDEPPRLLKRVLPGFPWG